MWFQSEGPRTGGWPLQIDHLNHEYNIKIRNRSFENVAKLVYLGIILEDQNCIYKEITVDCIWGMVASTSESFVFLYTT
jgi:hypothetical protein